MLEKIDKIKNGENVLFISQNDVNIKDDFINTFDNVIVINFSEKNNKIIDLLNSKKLKKIYLLGHDDFFRYMLPRLKKETDVCWIFKNSFSDLSNAGTRYTLHSIFEFLDRKLITSVGCFNKDDYEVFTNAGYECELIKLKVNDKQKLKSNNSNSIGILSDDFDPNNNFYNQLAALTFIDYDVCKFKYVMRATKKFISDFNLKCQKEENIEDVMKDNFVNLYINFTNTNEVLIRKSFMMGVPCIVGNSNIFDENKYLKEHLVVKSDDDINEIVDKINFVKANKDKIMEEYNKLIYNFGDDDNEK